MTLFRNQIFSLINLLGVNASISLPTLILLFSQLNATLVDSLLQYRATQADSVIVQNNAISVSDDWEENEKDVNRIFLATLAKGILPDSTQLVQLQYIAGKCPYEGGTAVFRARAILSGLPEDVFDNESLCSPPDSEELLLPPDIEPQYLSVVSIYPNPAKNSITLSLTEQTAEEETLYLINTYGQKIKEYSLPEGQLSFIIELPVLSPGIYYLKIQGIGKDHNFHKLIINK